MLAAEKWYSYQEDYKKYGIDLKPVIPKKPKHKKKKEAERFTAKDKSKFLCMTIFAGLVCISLIVISAYSAQVTYQINSLMKENAVLEGEIENLNVQIKSQNNIQALEWKAQTMLGMIYPTAKQYVYLEEGSADVKDFAMILKTQAYNN